MMDPFRKKPFSDDPALGTIDDRSDDPAGIPLEPDAPVQQPAAVEDAVQQATGEPATTPDQAGGFTPRYKPGDMVSVGQTTQYQGPEISKAAAARIGSEAERLGAMKVAAIGETSSRLDKISAERVAAQEKLRADMGSISQRLGVRGKALTDRLARLDGQLEERRKELANERFVPLGDMSRADQVVLAITAAIESGSAASLRRPSNAAAMIERAVEQSWRTYQDRIKRRMDDLNLTREDRELVQKRLDTLEPEQREYALKASQVRLAGLAGQADDARRKLELANVALAVGDRVNERRLQLEMASTGRATTTTQKVEGEVLNAQQREKDFKEKEQQLKQDLDRRRSQKITQGTTDDDLYALDQLQNLEKHLIRLRPLAALKKLKDSDSQEYDRMAQNAITAYRKAVTGVAYSPAEAVEAARQYGSDITLNPLWGESQRSALKALQFQQRLIASRLALTAIRDPDVLQRIPQSMLPLVKANMMRMAQPGSAPSDKVTPL